MTSVDMSPSDHDDIGCASGTQQSPSSADSSPISGAGEGDGRSVQEAWRHLRADADSDTQLSEDSPGERARQQAIIGRLAGQSEWMVSDTEVQALSVVSIGTSEHIVYRLSDKHVLKATLAGWYGQIPAIIDGKLCRIAATPAQYLDRLSLYNVVFNGEVRLMGFCVSDRPSLIIGEPPGQPSIVVAQPYYVAATLDHPVPSPEELSQFMRMLGFHSVPDSYFGWVRFEDGVVIVDAKPDNFVLAVGGIIPIDLQIAQFDPELLRQLIVD